MPSRVLARVRGELGEDTSRRQECPSGRRARRPLSLGVRPQHGDDEATAQKVDHGHHVNGGMQHGLQDDLHHPKAVIPSILTAQATSTVPVVHTASQMVSQLSSNGRRRWDHCLVPSGRQAAHAGRPPGPGRSARCSRNSTRRETPAFIGPSHEGARHRGTHMQPGAQVPFAAGAIQIGKGYVQVMVAFWKLTTGLTGSIAL